MNDDFLYEPKPKKNPVKVFAGLGAVITGVIIFAVLVFSSFTIIDTGERGVVLRLGRFANIMNEGLNFKVPFVDTVIKMNVRDVNYAIQTEVSSKDMQGIQVDVSLLYALDPASVGTIYQTYGVNYEATLIKPTLLEITNSVIANYPIEEFVEKRAEISNKINAAFIDKTANSGIAVKSLLITNHDFSDEYNKAIESKKVAEQGALKAKYDLERVTLRQKLNCRNRNLLAQWYFKKKQLINGMVSSQPIWVTEASFLLS